MAVAVALAVISAAVTTARPARATTKPGILYIVNVTLTDKKIRLSHRSDRSLTRMPRGAYIRYVVTNRGTRRYAFRVWETQSATIAPRRRDTVVVNWNYRGRFPYLTIYRGKPAGPKGYITIY
jgi:hypothetical protein